MRSRPGFSARAGVAAVVCSIVFVVGGFATATSAGASLPPHSGATATFTGATSDPVADPSCPRDPEFLWAVNYRERLSGVVRSRFGSARLSFDVCRIFTGALGGTGIQGSFALATWFGTLRGSATGTIAFDVPNTYHFVLTVERGTFLLSHVTGTLTFDASKAVDGYGMTGTVTSNLSLVRSPGHLGHPVPWDPSA